MAPEHTLPFYPDTRGNLSAGETILPQEQIVLLANSMHINIGD